ncbi:MAG TPA: hypothetical protein VFX28_20770 [Methylomirabilota bacterium]|nr:hypothetical protein [Methylomirabilota bacterium]
MADSIRRLEYFYVQVSDKPGAGVPFLAALRDAGVSLRAFSGFPSGRGAQLDFVPEDPRAFRDVARRGKWKLVGPKRVFLIEGDDRTGALVEHLDKLAAARINVIAVDAACAGAGRWGALLWVAPKDVVRAGKLLGAA